MILKNVAHNLPIFCAYKAYAYNRSRIIWCHRRGQEEKITRQTGAYIRIKQLRPVQSVRLISSQFWVSSKEMASWRNATRRRGSRPQHNAQRTTHTQNCPQLVPLNA